MQCDPLELACGDKKIAVSRTTWGVFAYLRAVKRDAPTLRGVELPDDMLPLVDFLRNEVPKDTVARYNFALALREHCNIFGLDVESAVAGRVELFVQEAIRAFAVSGAAIGLLETTWPEVARQRTLFALTRWQSLQRLFLAAALPLETPLVDLRVHAVRATLEERDPALFAIVQEIVAPVEGCAWSPLIVSAGALAS